MRDNMKTKLLVKLMVVLSLCLAVLFVFTACKDDVIYAGSDDFQSYPEYWNDFNDDDSGDIILPNGNASNTETPGEDPNANFTPDDEDDTSSDSNTSSETDADKDTDKDTDNDGTPDSTDPDDDNDGTDDSEDTDDDNDGTPDSEEKPDYGNQGPLVFF